MDSLVATIQSATAEVERLCEGRTRDRERGVGGTIWRGDASLRHNVRQLKVISEGLGAQCTKVSLLALRSPNAEMFDSLAEEIVPQIEGFSRQFTNFTRCSVSLKLLIMIGQKVRTFLKAMSGLMDLIQAAQYSDTPGITGKIHELAEAIKKLPETNRVAYRRTLMEQVNSINETIGEFQVHVDKYKTKYGNENGDGEEPTEEEDEDEEGEYTAEEVVVVEKVLSMLTFSQKVVKGGLIIVTDVADQLHPVAEDDADVPAPVPSTVFSSPSASTEQSVCQEWVAQVVQAAVKIEKSAVNVGSELYSPCENPQDVHGYYNACLQDSFTCLDLLSNTRNYVAILGSSCQAQLHELNSERLAFSLEQTQL